MGVRKINQSFPSHRAKITAKERRPSKSRTKRVKLKITLNVTRAFAQIAQHLCNLLVRRVHGQPVDNCCQKHLSFVTKVTTGDAMAEVMEFDFHVTYINL
jgi:hypothetical protein